jgi:hypothetical protein
VTFAVTGPFFCSKVEHRTYGYSVIVGKLREGIPGRRQEDNIKMVHQEVGWGAIEWIDLAQERDMWQALVNTVMDLRVP